MYKIKDKQQKESAAKNILIINQNKEIEEQKDILVENIKELEIAHLLINSQNQKLCNINEHLDELVKEKTKELISTNEKLYSALKELDTFIYKTSHDIRGPLARLMGLCNIALLDIKHKKSVEFLKC
jgi:signal transduction histidine kinase